MRNFQALNFSFSTPFSLLAKSNVNILFQSFSKRLNRSWLKAGYLIINRLAFT